MLLSMLKLQIKSIIKHCGEQNMKMYILSWTKSKQIFFVVKYQCEEKDAFN